MKTISPKLKRLALGVSVVLVACLVLTSVNSKRNHNVIDKARVASPVLLTTATPEERETLKEVIDYLVFEKNDFAGAIKASDDFTQKYGDDLDVWIHRGMSYYQLGDCANASASLYHASMMGTPSETMSREDVDDLFVHVSNSNLCKK